jgi:hypothetical protein
MIFPFKNIQIQKLRCNVYCVCKNDKIRNFLNVLFNLKDDYEWFMVSTSCLINK